MKTLFWGASLASLVLAGQAQAQEAEPAGQTAETAADAREDIGIKPIVVTANRRAESVQDSSLAIAVIGGDELENAGVTDPSDLGKLVPGLTVSLGGGGTTQTYLRGVGNFATDANAESAVAYNINGVYISRPNAIGPIFFDLDRVEVVKGPQGTLYGRNATGGAINLITRKPQAGFSGEVTAEYGNYNQFRVAAAVGGGSEEFAVRGAVQYNKHDGYLSDGYNDADNFAARLTALMRPSDAVELQLTGEYTKVDSQGGATVKRSTLTALPDDPWDGPSGTIQQPPTAFIPGGTSIDDDGFNDIEVKAISAELNVDLGGATLTFIPAYRDTATDVLTYTPGFSFRTAETSQQQSYELRLGDDTHALKWVIGGYFFDEKQTQNYTLRAIPIQQSTVDTQLSTRAYAVFGDATLSLTPELRVIGGLRWSRDEKTQAGTTNAVLPAPSQTNNSGERNFEDVSWRAGVEYDVGLDSMLFATAASAYKAGGFFPSVPSPNNSYEPESLTAFTVGSRNQFMDRTLQLNLEGFYWKYDNKQERFLGATPGGTTGLLTTNAGKATIYGANVDLQYKPTRNDLFRFTVEYLHGEYDRFQYNIYNPSIPGPVINSFPPQATTCTLGPVVPYTSNDFVPALQNDSTQTVDCSGKPLVRAPKWSGSAGYQRTFELGGGNEIVANVDGRFASSQYLSPDFIESGRDDGYFTLSADVTLALESGLSLTVWGRNLTNEAVYTAGGRYAFSRAVEAGGDPTLFYANIREPRTYGATVKYRF